MLTVLALLLAGLLLLGLLAPLAAGSIARARLLHGATAAAAAGFAALAVAALAAGGAAAAPMPFGPPFAPALLALDGLSAWFLLILGLSGTAASLAALGAGALPARALVPWPIFLGGMGLTLAAADGFTLILGLEATAFAGWALVAAGHDRAESRDAARRFLGFALFSAACLVPAIGLLAAGPRDFAFAALRASPPEGWRAAAVLALALAGAGAKAGLAPLDAWLPPAQVAAAPHVAAAMAGAMTKVALYVLARLLFDLSGPAQPLWWGLPLLALGAGTMLVGALRANLETCGRTLLGCSTIGHVGLVTAALGLALLFRGADLAPLAALAAGAALLHALAHGVFKTLLVVGLGEVARAALSARLDRLGGLIRGMPWTAAAMLAAVAAAAALPPLSGFASAWLLLQSLLAGWRVGAFGVQVAIAAATAVVALAAALAAAGMIRFFGLAFLGRPRTPRAAGAAEAPGATRVALAGLAVLTLLIGLLPGPLLDLGAEALRLLSGGALATRGQWPGIGAADAAGFYPPLAVLALLALAAGALAIGIARRSPPGVAAVPAWNGGFIAPPPHLPLGDPATQPSAAGLAQPLRRVLRPPPSIPGLPAWLRDALAGQAGRLGGLALRHGLMLGFGLLVLLLALVALPEGR